MQKCPAIDYTNGAWTVATLVQALANEAYRANVYAPLLRQWVADVTVVVVEAGVLGSADAANLIGRRRAIIVDEGHPDAVIHELGHTAGLNNEIEDYDWSPRTRHTGRPRHRVFARADGPRASEQWRPWTHLPHGGTAEPHLQSH